LDQTLTTSERGAVGLGVAAEMMRQQEEVWYAWAMTRASLHDLIDQVPETEIDRVARLVEAVNANDRLAIQLALAPEEPAEPDEIAAIEEFEHDPERGQLATLEQVKAELGIT
jgi:predicted transcriptional regulator